MFFLPEFQVVFHALIAALVVWGGLQDWKSREVSDWLTWPLFVMGAIAAVVSAANWNPIPLFVMMFILTTWYFNWLGGADARILIGLWGLWPMAGFLGMVGTGVWGLAWILLKHRKDPFPALVPVAYASCLTFLVEVAKMWS